MSNQTVYVELNALMDTRIACIEEIYGVSTAKRVLANGYETRETDDWGVLDTLINTHGLIVFIQVMISRYSLSP